MSEFIIYPPPLGELVDLKELDRARAEYNAQLECASLETYPELLTSFYAITENLNHMRISVGAPEMSSDASVVKLMNQAQWNNLRRGPNASDSAAYYDPLLGNIYHQFDEEVYNSSKVRQMITVYTLAHELSHKATHGLEKYSFNLNEGIADFAAQYTLENGALTPIISKEKLDDYRQQYLKDGPIIFNGDTFGLKDIFVVPNEDGSGLTRVPQLRLIEALQTVLSPERFNTFLKGTFTNDVSLVKNVLTERLGEELAYAFDDATDNTDPRILTQKILQATAQ